MAFLSYYCPFLWEGILRSKHEEREKREDGRTGSLSGHREVKYSEKSCTMAKGFLHPFLHRPLQEDAPSLKAIPPQIRELSLGGQGTR